MPCRHTRPLEEEPMAQYTLADLPYDYGALAPHISGKLRGLDYGNHHQPCGTGPNPALQQTVGARAKDSLGTVNLLQKNLAFNLAGHVNHTVFWQNLSPEGGDKPTGELAAAIDEFFGSFDGFRAHFSAS